MAKKRKYKLVKNNCYALTRIKRKVLRTAVIINLSIGLGSITIFSFDKSISNENVNNESFVNVVDFNEDVVYLDLNDVNNQNLVRQLEEYHNNEANVNLTYLYGENSLSDINNIEIEQTNLTFEQETIMKYCAIYQVDYNRVYNKLAELTNSFTSEEYLNGTIPSIRFKSEQIEFTNKETLLAMAVRCCAQLPETVGLDDSIKIETEFISHMSIFEQITVYSELFGLDRRIVYSVLRAENSFGSDLTDRTNNFGSLKIDDSFASYDNVSQGILEACAEIYKFRHRYEITATGEEFLRQLQPYYAPTKDVPEDEALLNENWLNNAIWSYREVNSLNIFNDETLDVNIELDSVLYREYASMFEEDYNTIPIY